MKTERKSGPHCALRSERHEQEALYGRGNRTNYAIQVVPDKIVTSSSTGRSLATRSCYSVWRMPSEGLTDVKNIFFLFASVYFSKWVCELFFCELTDIFPGYN